MDGEDSVIFIFHFHFFAAVRLFAICPCYDSTSSSPWCRKWAPPDPQISDNYGNGILNLSITIPCRVDTFTFLHYDICYSMKLRSYWSSASRYPAALTRSLSYIMIQGAFFNCSSQFSVPKWKRWAANQRFRSMKFSMYKRSPLVEHRFSF